MADKTRAFWIAEPGRGEIRTAKLPAVSKGDVVVRALFSGISRGTEALVFNGHVPESERERMRAPFQEGDFPAPVKYGYSSVGRIEEGADGLAGRNVFVLYPHQTRYAVPAQAVHIVPDDVPPQRAILAANLETAINGLWDASPHIGDRVSVVGGGTVGCLCALLASRIVGCEVELVDANPTRANVARALGVRFAAPHRGSADADVVIHASGSPEGLATALQLAGFEGRIVELSWFGDRPVTLPLGARFHASRLSIVSSQVGSVATSQRARWDTRRRMQLALRLLADPIFDVLITGECAFDDLPEVMATITAPGSDVLCQRVRY